MTDYQQAASNIRELENLVYRKPREMTNREKKKIYDTAVLLSDQSARIIDSIQKRLQEMDDHTVNSLDNKKTNKCLQTLQNPAATIEDLMTACEFLVGTLKKTPVHVETIEDVDLDF